MTTKTLNETILRASYAVNEATINERGVWWEMRRKNKGGTKFLVVYTPLPDDWELTFYFPTQQLLLDEILQQFENL
jgi:hypothetical protein